MPLQPALDGVAHQRIPRFAGCHSDHRAGTCRRILGNAARRDLHDRAIEAGVIDQKIRAATQDQQRFFVGI